MKIEAPFFQPSSVWCVQVRGRGEKRVVMQYHAGAGQPQKNDRIVFADGTDALVSELGDGSRPGLPHTCILAWRDQSSLEALVHAITDSIVLHLPARIGETVLRLEGSNKPVSRTSDFIDKAHQLQGMMYRVLDELARARHKFPNPQCSMTALTEEVGELAKALLDESSERVVDEAVQVAVMAFRVALEGDPTLNSYRQQRGAGPHPAN